MIYGFIGTGNMGGALVQALCQKVEGRNVLLANRTAAKAQVFADRFGCTVTDNRTVADRADLIFLGVKPQMMADLLAAIAPTLTARQEKPVLVTMAAGLTMDTIRALAGGACPVLRIMPNTPASVGEGMTLYAAGADVSQGILEQFLTDLEASGRFLELPEHLMDAGSAVSGCGPAFADLFAEALADGGVACGLPRVKAQVLAAQMLLGAAKLMLDSGKHPGQLKDEVCSPGGSTIQGVRALEEGAFRATVMDAVIAAYERTRELG